MAPAVALQQRPYTADPFADGKFDAQVGIMPQGLNANLPEAELVAYMQGYLEGFKAKIAKPKPKPKLKVRAYVKRQLTPQEQYQADELGRIRFEYWEIEVYLDPIPKPITPRVKAICRCLYPDYEFDSWHTAEEDDDAPF